MPTDVWKVAAEASSIRECRVDKVVIDLMKLFADVLAERTSEAGLPSFEPLPAATQTETAAHVLR